MSRTLYYVHPELIYYLDEHVPRGLDLYHIQILAQKYIVNCTFIDRVSTYSSMNVYVHVCV